MIYEYIIKLFKQLCYILPGPPRSINDDILKSKQQIHDDPLHAQFFCGSLFSSRASKLSSFNKKSKYK